MTVERHVGLVAPLPPQVGGVASVAEWLLTHEAEIGFRYVRFDLWRPPEGESGGRFRLASVPLQVRLLVRFAAWMRSAPTLVHYCVSGSPTGLARDLVYLVLLRLARRTTIAHLHGFDLTDVDRSPLRRLVLRAVRRLSSELVAIAPSSAATLSRLGIPSRCVLNPIRLEPNGHRTRLSSAGLRLVFVGTYGQNKGCPELIDALAEVRASGVDATLRLIGREQYRGEEDLLRRRVSAHGLDGAVEFAGVIPPQRLGACYEAADALCLPSRKEALPMVVLEAMAFSLPVIATPVGGIPDLVEDGVTGLLIEPGDVHGLAKAIRFLAEDPDQRTKIGEAARARIRAAAGPDVVAAQWRDLYAEAGGLPTRVHRPAAPAS